ncbi:hypothetical protein G6F43_002533 [Rhizopus delemar]|nr:hypothetical protein G6F43_002533 [Rhizopus delemar]
MGEGAMEYIIKEDEFNLKNLANSTEYKEAQPVPIELDPEDENLCNRVVVVSEKVNKLLADKKREGSSYIDYTDDQKTVFLY